MFALSDLDPDWGSGVGVVIEWGDGTAPRLTDAKKLRQGDRLEHRYEVTTVQAVAVAADRFVSAAAGPELGRSVATYSSVRLPPPRLSGWRTSSSAPSSAWRC